MYEVCKKRRHEVFFAVDDRLSNKHRQIDLAENLSQNRMSLTYFTYYYYCNSKANKLKDYATQHTYIHTYIHTYADCAGTTPYKHARQLDDITVRELILLIMRTPSDA